MSDLAYDACLLNVIDIIKKLSLSNYALILPNFFSVVDGSTSDLASDFCLLSAIGVDVPDFGGLSRSDDSPTS